MGAGDSGAGRAAPPPGADRRLLITGVLAALVLAGVLWVAATRPGRAPVDTSSGAGPSPTVDQRAAPTSDARPTGSRATSTTATSPTTTAPPGPAEISLAFAGDLLTHGPVNRQAARYGAEVGAAYDYAPMLAPLTPILDEADVAVCHLEVVVAPPGEAVTSYPAFGAPAEIVDGAKAAGYDGCSNASNHSLDRGQAGIAATLDRFDQQGLRHAGIARSEEEAQAVTTYDVDGVQIAHLSYAYGFNGYRPPADAPWSVNAIDPARIAADAARARAGGAELVVVSLHWGDEYVPEPSRFQRDVAAALLPSPDIDVLVGHHAHVVQPIEQVEGTYVVWGLGNQLSNQSEPPRRDGLTAMLTATRAPDGTWAVSAIEAVPTYVELGSYRVLPVVPTLADPSIPTALRQELVGSYERTVATVTGPGTPGVSVDPMP